MAYTRYRLGMIYSRDKEYQEAIEQYQYAIRLEPDRSIFHYALGAAYAKIGREEEAIGKFKKAIKLDYYNAEAHFGLANAYLKQGKNEEGAKEMGIFKKLREGNIADMEQRVVLVPDNPKYHGELARSLYPTG